MIFESANWKELADIIDLTKYIRIQSQFSTSHNKYTPRQSKNVPLKNQNQETLAVKSSSNCATKISRIHKDYTSTTEGVMYLQM
jgi:hypothetical protein